MRYRENDPFLPVNHVSTFEKANTNSILPCRNSEQHLDDHHSLAEA